MERAKNKYKNTHKILVQVSDSAVQHCWLFSVALTVQEQEYNRNHSGALQQHGVCFCLRFSHCVLFSYPVQNRESQQVPVYGD